MSAPVYRWRELSGAKRRPWRETPPLKDPRLA
jgi:hypothetical protein